MYVLDVSVQCMTVQHGSYTSFKLIVQCVEAKTFWDNTIIVPLDQHWDLVMKCGCFKNAVCVLRLQNTHCLIKTKQNEY